MKKLIPFSLVALIGSASADTVGLWRFDEDTAAAGGSVASAVNEANPGILDAQVNAGTPLYSDDVPAAEIYDPVNDVTYTNGFSLDASGGDAHLLIPDDLSFNSSFTVEFFIKLSGEPGSYESFLRRRELADLGWQVDFDHAANQGYGRIRSRWDTPAGIPDNVALAGADENVNFTLGPGGNATAPKVFIDTGAKDELGSDVGPQNTGDPADYVFDAASLNPNEQDVALQGDGTNDVDKWHHVAMSFDETTGEIKFYFDYLLAQTRTLSDSEGDGYTHPAAGIEFGKLAAGDYGLLLDEMRYSDDVLPPGSFLREPFTGSETTTAFWRMEEDGATEGGDIISLENDASPLHAAAPVSGTPKYSTDVPGTTIYDPVADASYPNKFSLDATLANSRVGVGNDAAFDTSFTMEAFIKLVDEPGGYHGFMRRYEANNSRWQVDFDHGANGSFGRLRSRWDTPAAVAGTFENENFVNGPVGGAGIPDSQRIWIDTDLGDAMTASYDDASDWALDGDGVNDLDEWHHIAVTFDQDAGTIGFFYDYELMQQRTLLDTEADGYTHPAGGFQFGKFAGQDYGLLFDEVRYSEGVLASFQFLQAVSAPPVPLEITGISFDSATNNATVVWNSIPGRKYFLFRSADLSVPLGSWEELFDDEIAIDATMSFEDTTLPPGTAKMFYYVREVE
ncbi:LamG domain-containing protein [Akkermansiaceae bacterium]|nr:LamG domain-containing protein [Akkermansiaceae bacterium]MDA7888354.1 LamG domain-containing protein [Akkermansiaceae bacterium]MDB4537368.1 LamG domain-containing protein [Akkermansiaceae bacterium]